MQTCITHACMHAHTGFLTKHACDMPKKKNPNPSKHLKNWQTHDLQCIIPTKSLKIKCPQWRAWY